jgi:gliding motility-associated-like protein
MGLGVFSVTPAGVNFIGTYTGAGTPGNSSIKAAPNGEKVVANLSGLPGTTGTLKLLDFDNNTGQLSNPVPLSVPNFINSYEFSPNSRFLYTTQANVSSIPTVESIVRFDLQAPSIVASATTLGNITTGTATPGFQLAPDGKIYFLAVDFSSNTNYINRINCPNTIGATLELNLFTTVSAPRFYLNLPNFPSWLFENDDSTYVSLGPDTVDLCDVGGSYVLSALNPGATYLWSTGDTSQSIVVTTTGTYSVTVTGPCGVGTDQIVVLPCCTSASTGFPTVNASSVSGTCGQSNGTATATATGGSGNYAYTWSNGATDSFISGLSSGSYSVIATDQNGCSSTSQVIVSTSPAAGVTLTAGDTILGINESVTLTIDGGDTYNWSPATGLNCTDCPTVIASPQSSTTYTVTGTDSVGCPYLRVVNVVVDIICGELFVPDIFSPNGIGNSENEKLCVYSNCIKSMNLGIYNRWGELIFSTDNQNDCWDGTHKGVPVMTGVYTYRLFVEQLDGEKIERTGNITLTR